MKMWRWSNAAMSLRLSDRSRPLPKTSPDMSPMPTIGDRRAAIDFAAHLAQMALTDSHAPRAVMPMLLVVVAVLPPGGESVAQPEAPALGDLVGHVRKARGALVGGDNQVRPVAIEHPHARRTYDRAIDDVVGEIEHRVDQRLVCGDRVFTIRRAGPRAI